MQFFLFCVRDIYFTYSVTFIYLLYYYSIFFISLSHEKIKFKLLS
ncbi:hypothetical protein EAb13_CDS0008 [Acinetobacter phage EAb13]|nr:hypothetical protein EAb13_CDS0008 [Acinetobacter phage EAb13]